MNDPLLERIAASDPARDLQRLTPSNTEALADALLSKPKSRAQTRRIARRCSAAGVAAIAMAATVVTVTHVGGSSSEAQAAGLLQRAAEQLGSRADIVATAGQYYYRRAIGIDRVGDVRSDGERTVGTSSVEYEIWIGADGSGRIRRIDRSATRPRQSGEVVDQAFGAGQLLVPFGATPVSLAELASLTADPRHLRDQIVRATSEQPGSQAYKALNLLVNVMRNSPMTATITSPLYEAVASFSGMALVGKGKDDQGREGSWLGADSDHGTRLEVLLDPATGELLADREVALVDIPDYAARGTVVHRYTYITQGLVPSRDVRPVLMP